MFVFLLIFIIVCVFTYIYIRWKNIKDYWKIRGVPHTPPYFLLGNINFLQRQNPCFWFRQIYQRFRSPYVGVWIFWRTALVINSPAIAKNVLVKDAAVFRDRYLSSGRSDPIGALNIFTVKEPLWSSLRRRLTVIFTAHRLRAMHDVMAGKSKELVLRIRNEIDFNESTDLRTLYTDFTTDVFGTSAFGLASDATLTGRSSLRNVTKEFMRYSFFRGLAWTSIFFCPKLVNVFRFSLFPKSTTKCFKEIFQTIVAKRGGYERQISEPTDLLDALLKIRHESAVNCEDISEDVIIAQAAIFLLGGFDTSASALTYSTYELAFNSEMQDRLYNEILEAKQQHKELNANVLSGLTYMDCIIKEILRKYSSMGWLDRVASEDYKIDDHLTISAGTPVYVNAIGMHYDPDIFPEPSKFDPYRFSPEHEKKLQPFTYLPFGEGPRGCIGRRFALQVIRYALASVFLHYEARPVYDAPKPSDTKIDNRSMFLIPGEPLYVQFVPRAKTTVE